MNSRSDTVSSSSSDNDSDQIDDTSTREKRSIHWQRLAKITWPPQSTSSGNWRSNLRHIQFGNPKYGQKMQLFSRTGYHLGIYHHSGVHGTRDEDDLHTILELVNAGYPGHVRIKGLATNAFVGMDQKGKLYTEFDMKEENTVFIESLQGSYNVYLSRKYAHLGWYIGIKKSGKFKSGPKTGYGQKAIQFLPRRGKFQ
ncbi:hypothetical protein HHI36_015491 [Cryptolaemus montrouzieri]|uniref:Fibroblast growth factor n=1 Tax=Cryptolaemus montrouzieri TaxID=559131 RepID=A0ABD2N5Z5_9CUCU